jgi:hypothetical protein
MDPFSAVAIGATIAGGAVKAFGDLFGGAAQKSMYQYQAGLARMNAQITAQNANYAIQKGEVQAETSGMKTAEQIGSIKAAQAASGLDVNKGSPVSVRTSQQEVGNYDQALLRANAAKAAYGYRVQGLTDQEQARIDEFAGQNAMTAGKIGATASILGTVGSVAGKWTAGQSAGLVGGSASPGYNPGQNTDWPMA